MAKGSLFSIFKKKQKSSVDDADKPQQDSANSDAELPPEKQPEITSERSTSVASAPSAVDDCADVTADAAAGKPLPEVTPIDETPTQGASVSLPELEPESDAEPELETSSTAAPASEKKKGFWQKLTQGLRKTSGSIGSGLFGVFRGKKIDDELFEELETQLLMADLGVATTTKIIDNLTQQANRKQLNDAEALYELLQEQLSEILKPVDKPLTIAASASPYVILMTGVNGVGKTTTIGKLAKQFKNEGKSVMLAAGDTFRAAAVEQLEIWGERNDIPVIAQQTGADSASVLYDALQAAKARQVDVLIADTAGRLQNKANLMEELKKLVRVMKKLDPDAPHEVMLTLDAGTGQNAISQAKLFTEAVGVTGIVMTKLDGTAKGGVIFAVADEFAIPIRYIGVGEQLDDLRPFVAKDFITALFDRKLETEPNNN